MISGVLLRLPKQFSKISIIHIILLGLILRLGWLWVAKPIPVSDFAEYQQLAFNLITYHQFGYPTPTAYRLPGYPVFLALFSLISHSNVWLGFINVLLSLVIVYFVYILAIQLTKNRSIGIYAGVIAALYPIYIFFSPILASEHFFTVLLYAGLILLLTSGLGKRLYITRFFAGILFGLATLTRGEAIYYIPMILLLGFWPIEDQDPRRNRIFNKVTSLLLLFIAWGVIILPWYLRNQNVIGRGSGLGTSGGIMFYYGHHDETQAWNDLLSVENLGSGEITRSKNAFQKGMVYVTHTPFTTQLTDKVIESLRLYAPNNYPVFWSAATPMDDGLFVQKPFPGIQVYSLLAISGYIFIGALAVSSLFFLKHFPIRLWITALGFALMNLIGYAILFAATSRYRYSIEGFLIILAASALWKYFGFFMRKNPVTR